MNLTTMKKIFSLGSVIFGALLISACSKEPASVQKDSIFVVSAGCEDTKTVLDGKRVVWQESDLVAALCYGDDASRYSVSCSISPSNIDGPNADFEVTTLSGFQPRLLMSPSLDGYAINAAGDSLLVPVPDTFEAVKDNAPSGSIFSVGAIGSDSKTVMKNLMSFMKFEIESSDIAKIRLIATGGEGLSGDVRFSLETFGAGKGGDNLVNVIPPSGSECFAPGTYYVPVPSRTYSEGITVKFFRKDGCAAKKGYAQEYEVKRNRFIDMGRESDWDLEFLSSTLVLPVVFRTDASTSVFPFSDDPAALTAVACPAVANVAGKGVVGPYYLVGYPNIPFYFCIQNTSGSKSYFISQATYGMRLGGTPGDYITIPGIENYRLTTVYFEEGSSSSYYCITSDEAYSQARFLTATSVTINKNTNKTFKFDATQTAVGETYRFCTAKTNASAMVKLQMTYEIVD